jgi:Holliday junction resolvase RusA-like endonuclease
VVRIVVYGKPEPAGSKKAVQVKGRAQVVDANPKAAKWKRKVADHARLVMAGRDLLEGPVRLELYFVLERPKSHVGRRGLLRSGSPADHVTKPDALKLARAVEDALTGIVYRDDAQVTDGRQTKRYALIADGLLRPEAELPGVIITVEELAGG